MGHSVLYASSSQHNALWPPLGFPFWIPYPTFRLIPAHEAGTTARASDPVDWNFSVPGVGLLQATGCGWFSGTACPSPYCSRNIAWSNICCSLSLTSAQCSLSLQSSMFHVGCCIQPPLDNPMPLFFLTIFIPII